MRISFPSDISSYWTKLCHAVCHMMTLGGKKRFKLSSKNSGLNTDPWSSDSAGMMKNLDIDIYDLI